MGSYRVIMDGPSDFTVEITHRNGGIHTTGGFHTLFAADAWMADRIAIAEAVDASELAKLRHRS
jgi:hypothetical protein